jgi:NADH dehydrogenase
MKQQVVTIVGGTGFVGRYIVKLLAARGYTIQVISRFPDNALYLKTAGDVGQIVLTQGNLARPETLVGKLAGSYAVINLVGLLHESGGGQNFNKLHAQGAEKLAKMARASGVQRFIQMSALGVDKARGSLYARTKLLGEKAVFTAFPEATILRPSVMFGPEDNFFNKFARLAMISPALPLIGNGRTRFQPVYVGDVARAVQACLARVDTMGMTYELGGPQVYTFKELLQFMLQTIGRERMLIPVPFSLAALKALFLERLPRPLITRDQVRLLKSDNTVGLGAQTFANLGIHPTAMEIIVPEYLAAYRKKPVVRAAC